MPQLDFSTYPSQIFWLALTFLALYLVMHFVSLPKVQSVLHNRKTKISNDIEEAEKFKLEAESSKSDFTSVLSQAHNSASIILLEIRARIAKEEAVRKVRLNEDFAKQTLESERKIAALKQEEVEKLLPLASEVAVEIAKKISNVDINQDEAGKLISELFKERIKTSKIGVQDAA